MSETVGRSLLVVDDHEEVRESLRDFMEFNGFEIHTAANGDEARAIAGREPLDLTILDIMMPGEDGISVGRNLRSSRDLPVIFLTARDTEMDRVVGLEVGADDYVVKPFSPRELLARVKAVLGRVHSAPPEPQPGALGRIRFHRWDLEQRDKKLICSSTALQQELTDAEFDLLMVFLCNPRRTMTRDELMEKTRRRENHPLNRTIDNQVRRLRKKIEEEPSRPSLIRTVWGRGYCLDTEVQRASG